MKKKASPRRGDRSEPAKPQAKRPRQVKLSSPARRVGGGYEIEFTNQDGPAVPAAASVGQLLQGLQGPLTEQDLCILKDILQHAEATAKANGGHITLARLLQAYDVVLPRHGLLPQDDTYYYRILLKLAVDPSNDWWDRFYQECKHWKQTGTTQHSSCKGNSLGPVTSPAKRRSVSSISRLDHKQGVSAAAAAASSLPSKQTAVAAPAAFQTATAALNAASAAIAAAWADAGLPGVCSARLSGHAATGHADEGIFAEASCTLPCCAAACTELPADTWFNCSSYPVPWQPSGAIAGAACACSRQGQCPLQLTPHHAATPSATPAAERPCSRSGISPTGLIGAQPRARSASSLRSSCADCAAAAAEVAAAIKITSRQRSRSASPCLGGRCSSSSGWWPCSRGNRSSMHEGCRRVSSSSSAVHEYPVAAVRSFSAVTAGAFQPPTTSAGNMCSELADDVLPAALLSAAERDRLWNSLSLQEAADQAAAQQQNLQRQRQQMLSREAVRVLSSAQQQPESELEQQPEQQLEAYKRFLQCMAVRHNWRARALAARTARDVLAAAEQLWRLAMSFWEVHAAWRCFTHWQQQAAAAAQISNSHYRQHLLMCSFQWWRDMVYHYQRQHAVDQQQQSQQQQHSNHGQGRGAQSVARCRTPHGQQTQQSSLAGQVEQQQQQQLLELSRPTSPLTAITRLLQQHPDLRPPCTAAGEMRQQPCGRLLAAHVFAAWLAAAKQKAEEVQLQQLLAWHHVQHVQSGVWNSWCVAFEERNPHHKLMRVVYRARRHSILGKVVRRWKMWAPVKHAKRRRLRDAQMALSSSKRRRVWKQLREYTAKRRVKGAAKKHAYQHFRRVCLSQCLAYWLHVLDIRDAFEELADSCWERLLQSRAKAMLVWWSEWVVLKQQRQELLELSCTHMEAFVLRRCLATWQARVLRKQDLEERFLQGLLLSSQAALRAAFRGWLERTARHKRHQAIARAIGALSRQRQLVTAWVCWHEYVARRRQQAQQLLELTQHNQAFVWNQVLTAWQGLLRQKMQLIQAIITLQRHMVQRCVHHWKGWVDKKVDWRNFQSQAVRHMAQIRAHFVLRLWRVEAYQRAMLRHLLAGLLGRNQLRLQQRAFGLWRQHLLARVAKRMNQLSALVQWEQSMTRRALRVWISRAAVWHYKRQQLLRADSYRALRLLDIALTSWSSLWAESQEFAQKAAFFLAGKQAELKVLVLRSWGPEAARLRLKRERLEIARLHCIVTRQHQILTAWHTMVVQRLHLRELLGSAVQRWSHLAVSRAFQQWKSWALHKASLHRRMGAVVSLLAGRHLQWAFCMMRENALRKRRTRSARHHRQRQLAVRVLRLWKQMAVDAATFQDVLLNVGQRMRVGLLAEALTGWRDVVRSKQWKEGAMLRALMRWGGSRKQLCFQTWRQWVLLKKGKKASLRQAMRHWKHNYLARAFGIWQYYTQRKQVARHVLQHFRTRYLSAAFAAWHHWSQRKAYLAAVFAQLQGKGTTQVMRVVWNAWRSFVPRNQAKRHVRGRASEHRRRRMFILCFAAWHDYAAVQAWQRQQLAEMLLQWSHRRMWLALDGWRAVVARTKRRQHKLTQGISSRQYHVMAAAFRSWHEETQLQQYRRHVIVIVSQRVNNGLLLKAFNCWRGMVEHNLSRRDRVAAALSTWMMRTQSKAFYAWLEATQESILTHKVTLHWQQQLMSRTFNAWREQALVQQRHNIIMHMVTNRRVSRLLVVAWTAWREVIDQRRQVALRLRGLVHGWDLDQVRLVVDAWRQWTLLKRMGRLAAERWRSTCRARSFEAWRHWAIWQRSAAYKVSTLHAAAARRLAVAVLHEWAYLAWLLPREQRAAAFTKFWLQRRTLWAWLEWLQQRRQRQHIGETLATRWTNLHLAAAWKAWRAWVQNRQAKAQVAAAVAKRWSNLHLAAAFHTWAELVQVLRHHKAVEHTIAGRWRNLHTAAAFSAWRAYVERHKQQQAAARTVAARWNNLLLATAFSCWRQAAVEAAARAAAADASAARIEAVLVSAAFREWHAVANRKATLRRQASEVSGRQRRLYLELAYGGWTEMVRWSATKRLADRHWRLVVLRSLLVLWYTRTQKKAGFQKTAALLESRTYLQLLRRSITGWQLFVKHRQQKATADTYAASKLQQRVLLAWLDQTCQARDKATAAVNMSARVLARVHNQLVYQCFTQWRTRACRHAAMKNVVLGFSTRRLRACLLAWRQQAQMLSGAARMLRRLLASTLHGAFHEWRAVAQDRAYWHRVEDELLMSLRQDGTGAAARAHKAVLRWWHWPLPAAFDTWRSGVQEQTHERTNELKASKFLLYALAFKALTGFKWAVQEAHMGQAAGQHRHAMVKRAVLRSWQQVARYLQEKHQKYVAASFTWATNTLRKGLLALLSYSQFRRMRVQQTLAARHHFRQQRKAAVLTAWYSMARYLAPMRRALNHMSSRRHHSSLRKLFAAWRRVCHRSYLLRLRLDHMMRRQLAAVFEGWQEVVLIKNRHKALLHAAVSRLSHLLLARAFSRWFEAAQQLKQLRAKAQQVLRNTLQRRMRAALIAWLGYVEYREVKRAMITAALWNWSRLYLKHSLQAWFEFVKDARQHAALSEQMLKQRQRKQQDLMMRWWHLIAQDLHHHRVVLESFRARHVRQEGLAVFRFWSDWAHWRALERKAIIMHWNKLILGAFRAWVQHHEDLLEDRAIAHDVQHCCKYALTAWKVGMSLIHRKRSLMAAGRVLHRAFSLKQGLASWMRYTYYKHMGHVALHFRVRRLACVVLQEWHQAAHLRAEESNTAALLTHQLATKCAAGLLVEWQQMVRARRHRRQHLVQGCMAFWAFWAPQHRACNAGWRAAAQQLLAQKLARCFFSWRWYCQVRMLREVAFQNKQRAIREALAIGEQVARRRRAALLASTFMAWHVQVSKYRKVAQKLAGLLHRSLLSCLRVWREVADQARVNMLQAQRHHAVTALQKLLSAWCDAAAELHAERLAAEKAADKLHRRHLLSKVYGGWQEQLQVVQEQRQGLWQLMLMLLGLERLELLGSAVDGWQQWAQDRVALRSCITVFVNKRRLNCLSEHLTLWHQYTAAMRGPDGSPSSLLQQLGSPAACSTSPMSAAMTSPAAAMAAGQLHQKHAFEQAAAAGSIQLQPPAVQWQPHQLSPGAAMLGSPADPAGPASAVTAGLLPVTGGPGSPVLGPRSAQQDRRLARRLAAMGGAAAELDPGSDDEQQLFAGLPATRAAAAAFERQQRQEPLLMLSRGYKQRRVTLGDDRRQYDDAAEAATAGVPSPGWDLHSVAESMRQAHELGLPPWQLRSVRSTPSPKPPHQSTLSLDELRSYQMLYPYSLQEQQQKQFEQQQQRQGLLRASRKQPIGRPGSACSSFNYQPLLQQQLQLQEELQQQQQQHWQQLQQHWQQPRPQSANGHASGMQPAPLAQEPWHEGRSRWPQEAPASVRWQERRRELLPTDSTTSSSASSTGSPSDAVAEAGSTAVGYQHSPSQHADLRQYYKWADKAWSPEPCSAATRSPHKQLPSCNGQVLPRSLAALVTPLRQSIGRRS